MCLQALLRAIMMLICVVCNSKDVPATRLPSQALTSERSGNKWEHSQSATHTHTKLGGVRRMTTRTRPEVSTRNLHKCCDNKRIDQCALRQQRSLSGCENPPKLSKRN